MNIVIGTAGHIDHGKSALVKALTGTDPDRLKEEKARGITIELGFAYLPIGDRTIAFVDVPGHEKFVRTMLAGVGGIDAVMLVVAADESVMPQTREHFDICRLLRVERGVVVITKADLADADTLDLVRLEVRDLVAGSFLDTAPVVPVSSRTGLGLDTLRGVLAEQANASAGRPVAGAARLPIDRVFSMQGFGTVVTGTLVAGHVHVEDELSIEPGARPVRVRGVQVHGRRATEGVAGQRVALNLGGVDLADLTRGETVATPGSLTVTRRVDAVINLLESARPLKQGARVRFHQGTRDVLGRVSIAGGASAIEPGQTVAARLRLEAPAALTRGDRFILRAYSPQATIAGGQVLDPDPPTAGLRTTSGTERLAALMPGDTRDDTRALSRMIADAGAAGLPIRTLVSRGGVREPVLAATVDALVADGHSLVAGERLVTPALVARLSSALGDLVEAFHRAQPLADGIPREEARERLFARADLSVFELVLTRLAAEGRMIVRDRLARPGHRLTLSETEQQACDAIDAAYRLGGLKPPDATALSTAGIEPALVERMTTLLVRQKRLVRLDTLVFHSDALAGLKKDIQALKAPGQPKATVDVATFKDRYGVTRKFAIPLLEWLDRERVTRRVGAERVLL